MNLRHLLIASAVLIVVLPTLGTSQEIIDPDEARKDPDFAIQGEYLGEGLWPGGRTTKVGGQVIAQGNHAFRLVLYRGGLPGDGWQRGDDRLTLEGKTANGRTALQSKEKTAAVIKNKLISVSDKDGSEIMKLEPTERSSETLGAKPPENAVVLFDGSSAEKFSGSKLTEMKTLEAGCNSKQKYKALRWHIEFRLSWKPKARGQGRSNSGVFIGGIPEIQVLDSFGLEGAKNECGAFYGRKQPDVNLCFPPLRWQTYDVQFHPPKKGNDGKPQGNYLVTVRHNGIVIHDKYDTGHKELPARALSLQKHGNQVQYRNIWLVPVGNDE